MAQTKGKKSTSTKTKTQTKAKKTPEKDNTPPPAPPAPPIRREVCAFVFLFLAVFTAVGMFNTDGAFISFFTDGIKGFIGWGFWLAAPAFLLSAYILGFHKGRPVAARVCCALVLPVIFAAMSNLMFYDFQAEETEIKTLTGDLLEQGQEPTSGGYDFPAEEPEIITLAHKLFEQGQALTSGGAVGGLLSLALKKLFSVYGAFPLLLALFALCLITACNSSISDIIKKIRERSHAEYDPAMYDEPEIRQERTARKPSRSASDAPAIAPVSRRSVYPIDIPLGDDEEALPLNRFETPAEPETKAKKAKVRRKLPDDRPEDVQPAPVVIPEQQPKAAESDDLEDGFREFPIRRKVKAAPVAMAAEINDPPKTKKVKRDEVDAEAKAVENAVQAAQTADGDYVFPPTSLLRTGSGAVADCRDEIMVNRDRLEKALNSFGVNSPITNITRGPTVTRYDIELEQGLKLAKVTNLAGDLALALGVMNVRVAPIPNMVATVGIEVPNKIVSTVYLRDIIESQRFTSAKSKLSFALGKDIGGECIVGNIAKLPHMLIAGTTGSGKSVCMNSLILSLLYKARPDEVRLIMIDPKMVELGVYNGIPHLYVPVVTDPKKAAGALQWSVVEMMKRYRLFSEAGVRDIANYNKHCAEIGEATIPQVVIVIDELADLMLVASKEVEESICRVAQMGRAAGMHLVIATQRPSADVITGLMKANIPSRIAFAVSSAMESRIILDASGAEKLVGMGDMLYSPVGCGKPTRIQGAFVSDEEREDVIQFIKESTGGAQVNSEIEEFMDKAAEDKKGAADSKSDKDEDSLMGSYDEMLPQAVEVVLEMKQCSVSMLQRRIKLGYSRAARIVDQMEELGVVGPYEGAKPRSVVIDRDGWNELKVQLGLASDIGTELAADMADTMDDEED